MEASADGLLISPVSAREHVGQKILSGTLQYPLARCIACGERTRFLIDFIFKSAERSLLPRAPAMEHRSALFKTTADTFNCDSSTLFMQP